MGYKNPIPHVDDERVSKQYSIVFTFETPVTKEEAVRGINELIQEKGGTIPANWIKAGEPCGMKHVLSQENNDLA